MARARKHSVSIRGHRTSFSIEPEFLTELEIIARSRNITRAALITEIDGQRPRDSNLSSSLRIHVLETVRSRSSNGTPTDNQELLQYTKYQGSAPRPTEFKR